MKLQLLTVESLPNQFSYTQDLLPTLQAYELINRGEDKTKRTYRVKL